MSDTVTPHDLFAAAALTGLLASNANETPTTLRRQARNWADAMLRERGSHIPDIGKKVGNTEKVDAALFSRVLSTLTNGGFIGRDVSPSDAAAAILFAERVAQRMMDHVGFVADSVCGVGSGGTAGGADVFTLLNAIEREYHRVRLALAKQETLSKRLADEVDAKLERMPAGWTVSGGEKPGMLFVYLDSAQLHAVRYGGTAVPLYSRAEDETMTAGGAAT